MDCHGFTVEVGLRIFVFCLIVGRNIVFVVIWSKESKKTLYIHKKIKNAGQKHFNMSFELCVISSAYLLDTYTALAAKAL